MRALIAIFLLFIILISSFKHAAIFVSFKLNQDYIAKNLCVDRAVEDSDCAGCCQLKKKQAEQNDNEDAPNPQRKLRLNIEWFCNLASLDVSEEGSLLTKSFIPWNNLYEYTSLNDCFHPPQML